MNEDPRKEFFRLFNQHWDAGTGLPTIQNAKRTWTYVAFARAMQAQGLKPFDADTVTGWKKGTRYPKLSRIESIVQVFFPPAPDGTISESAQTSRKEMLAVWELGHNRDYTIKSDQGADHARTDHIRIHERPASLFQLVAQHVLDTPEVSQSLGLTTAARLDQVNRLLFGRYNTPKI